jgi:hypothetical protein
MEVDDPLQRVSLAVQTLTDLHQGEPELPQGADLLEAPNLVSPVETVSGRGSPGELAHVECLRLSCVPLADFALIRHDPPLPESSVPRQA